MARSRFLDADAIIEIAPSHPATAVSVIDFADLGHPEMPGRALQEPAPQPFFQQRNTAAERGFRNAKSTPGRREPTMLNHPGEIVEVVEVLH
jgi:hypothetical protein